MTIPLPALLAMIVLLLWPAARLSAVLIEARGGRTRLRLPPRSHDNRSSLRRIMIGITTVAGQLLLFLGVLACVSLAETVTGHFWADKPPLLGYVSIASLFRFVELVQFAVFTIYAAVETRRALRADLFNHADADHSSGVGPLFAFNQAGAGSDYSSNVGSLFAELFARLKADLPVYVSAPVVSFALLLIVIGLAGHTAIVPSPAPIPG